MAGFDDNRQYFVKALLVVDDDHLRARHHNVANLGFGHFENTGKHALLFGVEIDLGLLNEVLDFFAAPGRTLERALETCDQTGASCAAGTWRFVIH